MVNSVKDEKMLDVACISLL